MPSRAFLLLIIFITSVAPKAEPPDLHAETARIVSQYKAVFNEPPRNTPNKASIDAPLLGNGDMGVAIAGSTHRPTFWLAKNDFWRLKSRYGEAQPRMFGRIELAFLELTDDTSYLVEQQLYEAVTVSTLTKGDTTLTMRTWVAATANVLVVELTTTGGSLTGKVRLRVGKDGESGEDWMTRGFKEGVDIPVEAACAVKTVGANLPQFQLNPGVPVKLVAVMAGSFKSDDPLKTAKQMCTDTCKNLEGLWNDHTAWWRDFWAKSYVEIGDADIMRHYYLSNYVMGSCSRDPEFPPGIFGTWVTTDIPAWQGDYHLNYNHMAPYYGLYSSNHIEQADPYHAPLLAFMERGKHYAKEVYGYRGILYPVGIGPKGIETTRHSPHGDHNQKEGLFYGQKSNAAYGVVNMTMRWRLTLDPDYAKRVYPYVCEIVDFWEDALTFEDGRYVIHGDSVHEGSGTDFNSIVSLGLVRNTFETALEMSIARNIDDKRREKWQHILDHLSGFATQKLNDKRVFRYTEKGTDWWGDNTLGIQHIYPASAIGLESDPELLAVSRNTIDVMHRWTDYNGMNSFFPAAVRIGYDPNVILKHLHNYVIDHANANGFAANNPHGIENCSIVPNTINEMLCMGHQNVLRVFPVWPRNKDARFGNIRAQGAFLVSSDVKDGNVQFVHIVSERGRDCVLENPWPDKPILLLRSEEEETLEGTRITFPTTAGESIILQPKHAP